MRYLRQTARPVFEDLLGTLVFYGVFVLTGWVGLAAAIGLAIGIAQIVRHKWRRERVPGLLVIGVALTVTLGGLSLAAQDERLILLKPTVVYCCLGIAMLQRDWVKPYVPAIAIELLPGAVWARVGLAWAWLMFGTALANPILLWAMPPHDAALWLLVVATGSKLALFAAQYAVLRARAKTAFHARSASATETV